MRTEPDRLLGESPAFLRVLEETSLVAPLHKPVLIVGERGTGKELIAARLHFLSNRWEGQFLKMNCAAISESLLETELFGHEAGAFTGASKVHHGRFERAHGGTLFLDELANTSMLVQEKLLRVIEYGEFERVGGNRTMTCDVRLVAATNEDLPALAAAGNFRHDLLDRLAFDVITLPPLRAREADIMLLAEHFAVGMAKELGRDLFPGFAHEASDALTSYSWPGNVRELKNVIERAVYRSEPDELVEYIVFDPFASPFRPRSSRLAGSRSHHMEHRQVEHRQMEHRDLDHGIDHGHTANPTEHDAQAHSSSPDTQLYNLSTNGEPISDLKNAVRDLEIHAIEQALARCRHNQRKAAEELGLTYHQLRGYLKKHDMTGSQANGADEP